jgi:hypothetical protein
MPGKKHSDAKHRMGKPASRQSAQPARSRAGDPSPVWKGKQRTLFFGKCVVKHFGRTASDAQLLLDALQGHQWAPFIDNPLPRTPGQSRKRHLHDVIQNFNRSLDCPLIKLRNDGDRVGWELLRVTPNYTRKVLDNTRPARKIRRHK